MLSELLPFLFLFLGGFFLDLSDHFLDERKSVKRGLLLSFISAFFLLSALLLEKGLALLYLSVGLANALAGKIDSFGHALLFLPVLAALLFLPFSNATLLGVLYFFSAYFDERKEFKVHRPFLKLSSLLSFIFSVDPLALPAVVAFDLGYSLSTYILAEDDCSGF